VLLPKYSVLGPRLNKSGTVGQSRPALFGELLTLGQIGGIHYLDAMFQLKQPVLNDYETICS
jgi:hypothetical protein